MSTSDTVRLDTKGRLTVPRHVREAVGLEAGDTLFLDYSDGILRFAKAENPFDALTDEAIDEYRGGKTRSLREWAAERGIDLDE